MRTQRLNATAARLRRTLEANVLEPHVKASAMRDVEALVDEVASLRAELRHFRPVPLDVKGTISANARKVEETAKRICAQFGVEPS